MFEDTLSQVRKLQRTLTEAETTVATAKAQIAGFQKRCSHDWSPVTYDPIVREGYRDPGDPPGTMGIDRRLPMYVPREETPRWKRTCKKCDLTEYTQRTKEKVEKNPVF